MIEGAALLSFGIVHYADFPFIIALLLFNADIAFFEEFQASNAVGALKKSLALNCRAMRDGKWEEIKAEQLVLGDLICIRTGRYHPC